MEHYRIGTVATPEGGTITGLSFPCDRAAFGFFTLEELADEAPWRTKQEAARR